MKTQRHYRGGHQVAGLLDLARSLRTQQTSAEALLWALLRNRQLLGFKFRRQHQVGDYISDFFCREAAVVIECDGGVHNTNAQGHHDQARDAYMVSQGIKILRFANDRVLNDTENVLREIERHHPSPFGRVVGVRD